jgi:hypothetical protein
VPLIFLHLMMFVFVCLLAGPRVFEKTIVTNVL